MNNPVLILGGILIGGGIVALVLSHKESAGPPPPVKVTTVVLQNGERYRFTITRDFNGDLNDLEAIGFTSVHCDVNGHCVGLWGRASGSFTTPPGMTSPVKG